jgi:transcriptional regulator with XRE-family HTH domain
MENRYDFEKKLVTNEAIASRLALTRRALGYSQGEFAAQAGMAANTYNQYETGTNRPSLDNALKLCHAYDLSLDWIYRGDPAALRVKVASAIRALKNLEEPEVPPAS